jgi:NADH dehydrogenase [ubiquinone] 1 alpha subcomplex assembly factor 7
VTLASGGEGLREVFARLIASDGPISVARFMAEANARYYASRDPLGRAGDFVTAPEISQMFGEMVGLWLADVWTRAGAPEPVRYVELGPGRGTLAHDALRTMRRFGLVPDVHLVEGSPALRRMQARLHPGATWHEDLASLPEGAPLLVVANEFFDALPVRQLVRTAQGWRERMVGLRDGTLAFVAGDQPIDAALPQGRRDAAEGAIVETSPAGSAILAEVARLLAGQGGAALVIDYGHAAPRLGSTLQAVRGHRRLDPLAAPGEADLSAHVDFAALADAARCHGVRASGPVEQGAWLRALGIEARAEALARAAPTRRAELDAAVARLTDAEAMGALFQVLGLIAPGWPHGAGF